MATTLTPSKRPSEETSLESETPASKSQKTGPAANVVRQRLVTYKVLCPVAQSGSVIGKGGNIVSKIRQETGAKIKLEDAVPGCNERIVIITSYYNEVQKVNGVSEREEVGVKEEKKDEEEAEAEEKKEVAEVEVKKEVAAVEVKKEVAAVEVKKEVAEVEVKKEVAEVEEKKEVAEVEVKKEVAEVEEKKEVAELEVKKEVGKVEEKKEVAEEEKEVPAAFDALMRVFERVMLEESDLEEEGEGEGEGIGGKKEGEKEKEGERASSSVTFRMLVLSGQVGSLLGKGGVVIKKIMADSGAQIRVLSRDLLPICAKPQEDVVQVVGELDSVRKAVVSIAKQLLEKLPSRDRDPTKSSSTPSASSRHFAPKQFGAHSQFNGYPHEPIAADPSVELMTFKMLCTNDQVGSVIGKAGYIVKNIKNETDSDITISELASETESVDRLITIKGPVFHGDSFSPVQHAVLRVQHRLVASGGAGAESKEKRCRLVIASSQVGCLLGKGGSIMAKMRKQSGAFIRIMGRDKDPIPDGIEQDEIVIQINGNVEAVQEAIVQITSKLKNHFLKDTAPPPFGMEPPFDPHVGRSAAAPHQHFPSQPPPFHGYGQPYEERPYDRHAPWGPPPAMREPLPDYASDRPRRAGKFSPGERSPVIPSITLEVFIPRSLVPSLCGEVGGCLNKIREISEAKITITELRPESPETVIIVYGVPEHAYCARSLLEAFVVSETPAPPDTGIELVPVEG